MFQCCVIPPTLFKGWRLLSQYCDIVWLAGMGRAILGGHYKKTEATGT